MTDDLERRLREYRSPTAGRHGVHHVICHEAADEIARLRAENEALREALEHIAALSNQREEPWPEGSEMDRLHFWRDRVIDAAEAARQALQEGSRHE